MSTKAQTVLEQIGSLPISEQQELWQELGRRIGQPQLADSAGPYGEPLTDEDLEQSARLTFQMLDEEEARAKPR